MCQLPGRRGPQLLDSSFPLGSAWRWQWAELGKWEARKGHIFLASCSDQHPVSLGLLQPPALGSFGPAGRSLTAAGEAAAGTGPSAVR